MHFRPALAAVFVLLVADGLAQEAISVAEVNRIFQDPSQTTRRRVAFRGVVIHSASGPRGCFIQAETAGVFVRLRADIAVPALGDDVEVVADVGFVKESGDSEIDAASVRVLGKPGVPAPVRCSLTEANSGRLNRLAVEVEAAVLAVSRHFGSPSLMLADASGAAMAAVNSWPDGWDASTLVGKHIRYRGVSAGAWHHALRCTSPDDITVLGPASEAGALAPLTTLEEARAFRGTRPALLRGVCARFTSAPSRFLLQDGGTEVLVNAVGYDPAHRTPEPGDEVRIGGVTEKERDGVRIDAWWIHLIKHATLPSPAQATTGDGARRKTVREVAAMPLSSERVVVSGIMTMATGAGSFQMLVVEDSTGSVFIHGPNLPPDSLQRQPLPNPGDVVEVSGFRGSQRDGALLLNSGVWRVTGRAPLPAPKVVTLAQMLNIALDGRRVRVRGRMFDFEQFIEGGRHVSRLWLRDRDTVIYANYQGDSYAPAPARIGQLVEADGVCIAGNVVRNIVRTAALNLHAMGDVRALPEPPPWSDATALRAMIVVAALLFAASAWVFLLRRQVRARTAELSVARDELASALEQERELNAMKSGFISMVTHELRTPLSIIQSSRDILTLLRDKLTPEKSEEHLQAITHAVTRITDLSEEVLLFSRLDAQRMQLQLAPLDLADFCAAIVREQLSATNGKCPITFNCDDALPPAQADERLLRHILVNLLGNAVKYSPPGAPVTFSVARSGGSAVFTIADRGMGIAIEDQPRLFQSFYRGKNVEHLPGTGLGLVIVKRCVDLHGGTVALRSGEGEGTTVTIELPLFPGTAL